MRVPSIRVIESAGEMAQVCRTAGRTLGLVPTMGALHEGHLSLVRPARAENKTLVVSIFVNPAQFGNPQDLAGYPRDLERDLELLKNEGADLVIEAVGSVETLNQALQLARPLGRIAVFGLPPTMDRVPFDWDTWFRKRLDMHTVFGAQDEPGLPAFQLAVDFIRNGEIDMAPFVTHQFPITRVGEAFALADSRDEGALKVSLTF